MGNQVFDEKSPLFLVATLTDSTGANGVGSAPLTYAAWRCDGLAVISSDTVAHTMTVSTSDGYSGVKGTRIFDVAIPASAGNGTVAIVDVLTIVGLPYLGGFCLPPTSGLWFNLEANPSTGTLVTIVALGGEL